MYLEQLSVFIENKKGTLLELIEFMGKSGIDMLAVSIAETTDFGILRTVVNDCRSAKELLTANNYAVNIARVLGIQVEDSPGGMALALRVLRDGGIDVEYMYSLIRQVGHRAVLVVKVSDTDRAIKLLTENGVILVTQERLPYTGGCA